MVAYSFQKRFAAPILAGTKRQTIRANRTGKSRHVRFHEKMELYTGMRAKHCKLIGRAFCMLLMPIRIDLVREIVYLPGRLRDEASTLDSFAKSEGCDDWAEFKKVWREIHPEAPDDFAGTLIQWGPLS